MTAPSELEFWKGEARRLHEALVRLRRTHELLMHHEWFAIGEAAGRDIRDAEGRYTLFFCDRGGTFPCCTLGPKDVLLVGRYTGEPELEAALKALAGEARPDETEP